jgi:hypothetical protein
MYAYCPFTMEIKDNSTKKLRIEKGEKGRGKW